MDFALERARNLAPDSDSDEYILEIDWLYNRINKNYQPSQAQVLPTTGLVQIEQLCVLVCERSGRETGGGLIIPNSLKDSLPLEVGVWPKELLDDLLSVLTSFRISLIAISFVLLIFLWTPSASFSSNSLPHTYP